MTNREIKEGDISKDPAPEEKKEGIPGGYSALHEQAGGPAVAPEAAGRQRDDEHRQKGDGGYESCAWCVVDGE